MKVQKIVKVQTRLNLANDVHRLLNEKLDAQDRGGRSMNEFVIHTLLLQLVGPDYVAESKKKKSSKKKEGNDESGTPDNDKPSV